MDGEALTLGDIQTFCFLAVDFFGVAFFDLVERLKDFIVEGEGGTCDLEDEEEPFFSGSFKSKFELRLINQR